MLKGFAAAVGFIAVSVLVFLSGLVYVRRRWGLARQNLFMATAAFLPCILFDLMVFYFSLTFCSMAISEGLRLRGGGGGSPLLESYWAWMGARGPDVASQFGALTPIGSWLLAHAVIVSLLYLERGVYGILASRTATAGRPRPAPDYRHIVYSLIAAIAFVTGFRIAVTWDYLLIRFFLVANSRVLRGALGENWAGMDPEEFVARLSGTVQGQMVLHSGQIYVLFLLLAAFAVMYTFHMVLRSVNTLPVRARAMVPPELPPPTPPTIGPPSGRPPQAQEAMASQGAASGVPLEPPPRPQGGGAQSGFYLPPDD
ncbi:MAG: hypothetical protein AB7Y46_03005 [Armatimonadota bacterium]